MRNISEFGNRSDLVAPMQVNRQEVESRMRHFVEVCRAHGLKVTHQRTEVFREVARTGDHPDAETVLEGVRRRVPSVSLDTVYRTLWLLNDLGLARTLGPLRERARFDANLESHHHFVCVRCGLTRDFASEELGTLPVPAAARTFGEIETIHVEAQGICRECARHKTVKRTTPRRQERP